MIGHDQGLIHLPCPQVKPSYRSTYYALTISSEVARYQEDGEMVFFTLWYAFFLCMCVFALWGFDPFSPMCVVFVTKPLSLFDGALIALVVH